MKIIEAIPTPNFQAKPVSPSQNLYLLSIAFETKKEQILTNVNPADMERYEVEAFVRQEKPGHFSVVVLLLYNF